ncbi:MAG: Crp/Fnr family transcriptional regulator [Chryseobacterium sp.]|uniref:Crp/Fnr family transcriptional regulator n=1 Tax=Epilithonimonas caeni TaxID=365343 RepID=UPI0003F64194|nr:Crp/Fnr family transcriptional regulator [Epilithonimonas caeni]MPS74632.1 Crp/Fnr family transcriptional regulator [Chryseobacterium sp.]
MEFIRQYLLSKNIPLDEKHWEEFTKVNIRTEFKKKDIILKVGEVENYLSFVEKGTARLFFEKENKDLTIRFVFNYQYLTAYDSFTQRTPSRCNVEALTDMVVWRVHYDDLQELYRTHTVGNLIGRLTVEALYIEKLNREFSFLSDTAEERYLKLMKEQPGLFKMIPLKHIASYMGITPQALSRIRRRIS